MENNLVNQGVVVLSALIGVAIIATLVSNKAQTSQVISAGGNAFAQGLEAALSPVTGSVPSVSSGGFGLGGASPINIQ
jgi:hypothetical protein